MIRNKEQYRFEIKENSICVYKKSCDSHVVTFNTFNAMSRHKFNDMKVAIAKSPKNKYDSINEIYGLARVYQVRGVGRGYMTVHKNIAY